METLAQQANLQVLFDQKLLEGKTTAGLSGDYTAQEALEKLLGGSGISFTSTDAVSLKRGPSPSEGDTLPEVKITASSYGAPQGYVAPVARSATKTDTPLMETPVSIQVIPKAVLEDKQAMSLPDAVNGHVSGVVGRSGAGTLYDNFIIRGLAGGGFGDAYRNGLYNRQDIYDVSNIEQIEVVKGPAAVLYGRLEPGGLVNYVTKKPLDNPYYAVQQQVGPTISFGLR